MSILETLPKIKKAYFRKCSIEDRKRFSQSNCIIPISVGQKVHEGLKFQVTMDLINKSFKNCIILIDDTIQRYTMKIFEKEKSIDVLREEAFLEGEFWLNRNKNILKNMAIPYKIMRWDDFSLSDQFQLKFDLIENLYKHDKEYKGSFDLVIEEFLSRQESILSYDFAEKLCLEYLKEECACMCLWADSEINFEVYPTGRNDAMKKTYEKLIRPINANILKSVAYYFKSN